MAINRCCCFDLRTGTLILFYLQAMALFGAFQGPNGQGGTGLISGIVGLLGLYGVYKEKPDFMWPSMITMIISCILLTIGVVLLPIVGVAMLFGGNQHKEIQDKKFQGIEETALGLLIFLEILSLLLIALHFYFYKVIKAYFDQLKAEIAGRTQNVHANNMERGLYPKV